jgi:hypothetical protein
MKYTLKTFYVIYLIKEHPDGRTDKHPVMQKTGEREVSLLAWQTREKAMEFINGMNLGNDARFSIDFEDELVLVRLRKKHRDMNYSVDLKIQE